MISVKPLVWTEGWGGGDEDLPCWHAANPVGPRLHVYLVGLESHADADPEKLAAAKADEESKYRGRVLSALEF